MKKSIPAALLLCIALPTLASAESVVLRAECRKNDDRGCSANARPCYTAPRGYYIRPSSIGAGTVEGYWLKNPVCGQAEAASFHIYVVPGLEDVEASLPLSFCAPLHVESGSGWSHIGRVAYVNCRYDFTLNPLPAP